MNLITEFRKLTNTDQRTTAKFYSGLLLADNNEVFDFLEYKNPALLHGMQQLLFIDDLSELINHLRKQKQNAKRTSTKN